MEDVLKKIIEKLPRETAGNFEAGKDALKYFKEIKEVKKTPSDFLKNIDSISDIRKLIKNKKLSNNQIKEFLNNPEELKDFLMSLLDEKTPKKEESKEAMGAASAGGYSTPLFSTTKGDIVNKVPTVREKVLKGGKTYKMTSLDIAKKHANNDSTDSKTKDKIEKIHNELKSQSNKGIKTEMEHTKDKDRAKEIAMDHLSENPKYYDKLKKIETKEATTSASSGQYSQPAIWAKSLNKKDFKGYSKPLYKGGKFVQVKKKCKKFPYCNQGDINALKIFENNNVQNAIDSVSSKFNVDREYISDIVFEQIRKTQR
jgi:hypothetical protein